LYEKCSALNRQLRDPAAQRHLPFINKDLLSVHKKNQWLGECASGDSLNLWNRLSFDALWANRWGFGMWTQDNRGRYDRSKLRYPSYLTYEEWALISALIPPAKRGGNKRMVSERDVVSGVMYILSTGCQWAALPKHLPPRSTLNDYFRRWDWDGTLGRIHHQLYVKCREPAAREASPTAAIIASQSVKSAEKGGHRSIRRASTRVSGSRARSATFS